VPKRGTPFVYWLVLLSALTGGARADEFYKDKTLTILIGGPAGGTYDLEARLFGRHLAAFIPGAPNVVMQNMPGAAGIRAANYLYNAAMRDGSTIALSLDNLLLNQFLEPDQVKFRTEKFNWIGRGDRPTRLLYSWTKSGIHTIGDARTRTVLTGMTAPGTSSELYPALSNALLGTKFKLISGYEGASGMNLALERGEIEAVGANAWISLVLTQPAWIKSGKISLLFQTTLTRDPELPNTPTFVELAPDKQSAAVIAFEARSEEIGFYLIAPPGVPADRVATLRAAFTQMAKSPDYLADAKKLNFGTKYMSGDSLQAIAQVEAETPDDIVDKFKRSSVNPNR
jgi:tripartite-type tricarboxylate transporter receptor subunit TctC